MMSELGRTTGDENTIEPVPYCQTFGVDDDFEDRIASLRQNYMLMFLWLTLVPLGAKAYLTNG
jgi:hypothetical protein